jgi:hypothetical protein
MTKEEFIQELRDTTLEDIYFSLISPGYDLFSKIDGNSLTLEEIEALSILPSILEKFFGRVIF